METPTLILMWFTPPLVFGCFLSVLAYKYGFKTICTNKPIVPEHVVYMVWVGIPLVTWILFCWVADVHDMPLKAKLVFMLGYVLFEMGCMLVAYGVFSIIIVEGILSARIKHQQDQYTYNVNLCNYKVGDYIATILIDKERGKRVFDLRLHVVREQYDCSGVYTVLECLEFMQSYSSYTQKEIDEFVAKHFNSAVSYDIMLNQGVAMSVVAEPATPEKVNVETDRQNPHRRTSGH